MEQSVSSNLRTVMIIAVAALAILFGGGLFWFLFLAPAAGTALGALGWYLFSFAAGLTMIVLPCTLPLAFVIVPLSMGKGMVKGLGMALSFGAGVAIMLSIYGVLAALAGRAGLDLLGAQVEDIKNWVYFIAGIFAYIFALGEIGLLKLRMPSYTGSAPDFIQKRKDYAKAFLLGLFLGNIGIGCPHPATPLILIEIASSGDIFYGWTMFLVHAIGRIVPLLMLAILGVLGVNGLNWLVARKEKIERWNGWAMVYVAGFILTLGLFTHDWWVNSGQHKMLEKITQESWFTSAINTQLGTQVAHEHGLTVGKGIFGQPLDWGNWFIVLLWVIPLWWFYTREKKRVLGTPALHIQHLERKLERIEEERRGIEAALHLPDSEQGNRIKELEVNMDTLLKEREQLEQAMRYGSDSGLRDASTQVFEEEVLRIRRKWYITLTLLLLITFTFYLPLWFAKVAASGGHASAGTSAATSVVVKVKDAIAAIESGSSAKMVMPTQDESQPHAH